ncbi:phytanoyl-CoA dioxygenase family protein [Paenibacillus aceris]|uniref:Ectoine hydroxylase-related dioxygenase (Phytanoyl-CoA dioxygenase family) n=1 Tax=Paenibacillus aceris TaxID=869555 RepID=A0ABS4I6N9_9BACL|nr:phytanoyl-CoA dioxygenase family protein [Paenibacillus aceris]MBP1966565.1 ectoine hydroxylase-related dioxygenase (phytanoyl-CoA dioxygenase family) [Paenibacillus aceris]NHW39464.1 phytanoyl-CoA dioxygenase family protein [Paenibacillus aceris]
MLSQELIKQFDELGFLKGDVVLSDDEVETLREELENVMEGKSVKKPILNRNMLDNSHYGMTITKKETVVQIVNIWMASDVYLQHAANRRICEEVAQLCRTDTLRIWHDQIQYKPPVLGGPTHWHQDHPLWPVIQPADLISAWVALDDAVIENGCMWMVPGSHKWGNHQKYLSSNDEFMPVHKQPDLLPEGAKVEAVPFEIKKGQVGYHHSLTWHGSPNNRSELKRRAIAVHYMPGHTYYAPTGGHPMEPHIHVAPGEIMSGESFPAVYQK